MCKATRGRKHARDLRDSRGLRSSNSLKVGRNTQRLVYTRLNTGETDTTGRVRWRNKRHLLTLRVEGANRNTRAMAQTQYAVDSDNAW